MDDQLVAQYALKLKGAVEALEAIKAGMGPTEAQLRDAPLIEAWQPRPSHQHRLVGFVEGHPHIHEGHITTSPVIAVGEGRKWVRTISRYYRMGRSIAEINELDELPVIGLYKPLTTHSFEQLDSDEKRRIESVAFVTLLQIGDKEATRKEVRKFAPGKTEEEILAKVRELIERGKRGDPRKRIIRNSAQCLECGDEIESKNRHDFRSCRCGKLAVDGGHEYLRRVFDPASRWKETSIEEGDDDE